MLSATPPPDSPDESITALELPATEFSVLLKQLGYKRPGAGVFQPMVFILDCQEQKFLYLNSTCKELTGFANHRFIDEGAFFFFSLWHKNDYKIYNETVKPILREFLSKQDPQELPNFSFSFNYRMKHQEESYLTVMQRSVYFFTGSNERRLIELGVISDINQFTLDSRMICRIEKNDASSEPLSKKLLVETVYYPDKLAKVFTNREKEILKYISEGLSSKEIANSLFISVNTINNHRKNMMVKTNTINCFQLLTYALKNSCL